HGYPSAILQCRVDSPPSHTMELLGLRPSLRAGERVPAKNETRTVRAACWAAILLAFAITAHAQQLPIKTYTTVDGLPSNFINRIVKDSRGFLWFCTQEGLARFDGYTFTNFGVDQGLPSPAINDLLETRGGEYWVATAGGLVRFDPRGTPRRGATGHANAAPIFRVVPT